MMSKKIRNGSFYIMRECEDVSLVVTCLNEERKLFDAILSTGRVLHNIRTCDLSGKYVWVKNYKCWQEAVACRMYKPDNT